MNNQNLIRDSVKELGKLIDNEIKTKGLVEFRLTPVAPGDYPGDNRVRSPEAIAEAALQLHAACEKKRANGEPEFNPDSDVSNEQIAEDSYAMHKAYLDGNYVKGFSVRPRMTLITKLTILSILQVIASLSLIILALRHANNYIQGFLMVYIFISILCTWEISRRIKVNKSLTPSKIVIRNKLDGHRSKTNRSAEKI